MDPPKTNTNFAFCFSQFPDVFRIPFLLIFIVLDMCPISLKATCHKEHQNIPDHQLVLIYFGDHTLMLLKEGDMFSLNWEPVHSIENFPTLVLTNLLR